MGYKKVFEYIFFLHRRNCKKTFDVDNSKKDASLLITCFENLCMAMHFDTVKCLQYKTSTFYCLVVDNYIS